MSRYMVLFGITYLRLDIFITWWMSIFQSTVVLRHFVSMFVHRYMLRPTPFSKNTRTFSKLSFTFWSSFLPLRVAYYGIPSFPGIIGPFTGFIIFWPNHQSLWVVILGHIPSCWVCLHRYLSYPLTLSHLIRSFFLSVQLELFRTAPISISHSSCQFSSSFGVAPISIDHLPISLSLSF